MNQADKFKKGQQIENYITSLFKNATQTHQTEFYDIVIQKKAHIEVKSAELRTSNGRKQGTRQGRFIVNKENNKKLIEKNGWYALVLTFKGLPKITRFIQAKEAKVIPTDSTAIIPMAALYRGITINQFKVEIGEPDKRKTPKGEK